MPSPLNEPLNEPSNEPSVSVWHYKPWWCQPGSIVLTGIGLVGGIGLLFRIIWLTVLIAIPVLIWMSFFLLIYPKLMAQSGLLQMDVNEAQTKKSTIAQPRWITNQKTFIQIQAFGVVFLNAFTLALKNTSTR